MRLHMKDLCQCAAFIDFLWRAAEDHMSLIHQEELTAVPQCMRKIVENHHDGLSLLLTRLDQFQQFELVT